MGKVFSLTRPGSEESFNDFGMVSACGPGEGSGPGWIVREMSFCAAREEKIDHGELAEFGSPGERCGTNIFVARVDVRTVVEKQCGVFGFATARKFMKGSDAEPIRFAGIHSAFEEEFGEGGIFGGEGNAGGKVWLVAEHEVNEGFMTVAGSAGECVGIVSQGRIRGENCSGGFHISIMGE